MKQTPLGIGLSDYHYYVLHDEGLNVLSRFT